jgi:hypothetical protein
LARLSQGPDKVVPVRVVQENVVALAATPHDARPAIASAKADDTSRPGTPVEVRAASWQDAKGQHHSSSLKRGLFYGRAQDKILRFLRFLGVHNSHARTFQES